MHRATQVHTSTCQRESLTCVSDSEDYILHVNVFTISGDIDLPVFLQESEKENVIKIIIISKCKCSYIIKKTLLSNTVLDDSGMEFVRGLEH